MAESPPPTALAVPAPTVPPALQPSIVSAPVLFVAREPDETLRTFLPVIDCLANTHGLASEVLFHHPPGAWVLRELSRRGMAPRRVEVPRRALPTPLMDGPWGRTSPIRTIDEVARLWQAKRLARTILRRLEPAAVVVIQDTLLLERFLVRYGNRLGIPTLVVQWAFSYPQELYDRLRAIQHQVPTRDRNAGGAGPRRVLAPFTRAGYRAVLGSLGLRFDLVNSYGGGEARLFAVMGEAFRDQYIGQGVRGKRIVVTGHPTHDAAFRRRLNLTAEERSEIRRRHDLPVEQPLVVYATQPVLWRRVLTPDQLRENVESMARAIRDLPQSPVFVIKLHPRERVQDYAFCARLDPPVRIIEEAEMADIAAMADVFVSSSSSTVLLAMMLDRPIVTVNFNRVIHFDFFEPIGGTLHTRTPMEFARAVDAALSDPNTRERLRQERARVLQRYTRFDGRAAERIAGLIRAQIEERRGKAVAR